ncbi:GNAT family N-acetyltransferase [Mesorhizobium sp. SP-1A]|uniref:GNAT family N-acetyltransferase n=1 Tax=Mesorhizobium sp. SP-1A TaxID=3077840 RepID=UPI0028F6F223|nr:GNAT family N-acetyltransferase [Mesorhizobium sp. SP-1A]
MDWLKAERDETGEGFYCNRSVIKDAHDDGEMVALIENDVPVAFIAYGLTRNGILEVRPDRRGLGYGKALAQAALQREIDDDRRCILDIECAPETSIPFWEKFGFRIYAERYAYKVLPKTLELPGSGVGVDVTISLYRDPDQHYPSTSTPHAVFKPKAIRTENGDIYLSHRVVFENIADPSRRDPVGRITVDGRDVFFNKVKYEEAYQLGIRRDRDSNFFVDRLYL